MAADVSTEPATLITPIAIDDAAITRQEWVYRQLREAILSGQFVPGRSVTLRGIGAMLDVSPTPVREALRRLVAERALQAHGNRRVSVPEMTPEKLEDICTARIALETLAAEQALSFIDADRMSRLWRLNTRTDAAIAAHDITTYLRCHREFHYALYDAGRAAVLMPLIESVWLQFSPFLRLVINHIGVDYVLDRHVEALRAIEAGDIRALRFAVEADIREGLGAINESDWRDLQGS